MRRQTTLASFAAMLLLGGCGDLLSLHGLYMSGGTLIEPAIEGQWVNDSDRLTVSRDGTVYQVSLQPVRTPSHESKFELRIVDINGVRFADIIPDEGFGHMFLK